MASLSKKLAERMHQYQRMSPSKPKMEKFVPQSEEKDVVEEEQSENVGSQNSAVENVGSKRSVKQTKSSDDATPSKRKKMESANQNEEEENQDESHDEEPLDEEPSDEDPPDEESQDEENEEDNPDEEREAPIIVKNIMDKTFTIDLSREVKDYVKDLAEQALSSKPPTAYKIKMLTNEALRQLLKYNDRPTCTEMTKHEVASMVLEYMKLGCPPRCPKCKQGALRFSNGKKRNGKRYFWCPGSTKDGIHFLNCTFKAQRNELERIPWRTPP